ncbi:tetratricopeptide repeat protein [Aeromonas schubertii]|uniref:tetratricopeptide repeat protein n=1 Tax=Aeromonas schubertii TaxID=652 RepID=UPI0010A83124|nr:tetratricopeptide repeat protein [Aeromonas schubertii]QCG47776.1 sel1 repeat family protein [Aeromonas schubertii]
MKRILFLALILGALWRIHDISDWQRAQQAWQESRFVDAVVIWQRLREQGDLRAQVLLAHAYEAGAGVAQDSRTAIALYEDAARRGEASGQYRLAEVYLRGEGTRQDLGAAYRWMEIAAKSGVVAAQLKFGVLCLLGIEGRHEWEKGKRWLVRAASSGNESALRVLQEMAKYELGEGSFSFDELERLVKS